MKINSINAIITKRGERMNNKSIILIMMFLMLFSSVSFANSAEPPSLIIVVPSMGDQVEISIDAEKDILHNSKVGKIFETYHQFYIYDLSKINSLIVQIDTGDEKFNVKIDEPFKRYRNTYTLDINNQTLIEGYNRPFLNILLISVRILLTLIIEGFIFYALGFRWKQSWQIFLRINLITQGALNVWLSTFTLASGYSVFFALVFAEVLIIIVELITFLMGINEKNKLILLIHVVLANVLSFVAGGYLITWLPL